MKTKAGKYLLKKNSKAMDAILKDMTAIAKELSQLKTIECELYGSHEHRLAAYKVLKSKRDALQSEINDMIFLEKLLWTQSPKN